MTRKGIRFTPHAWFQINRRGIKRADVIRTVRSPEQIVPSLKGRAIHQSRIGRQRNMLLRVVVKEGPTVYHVITAYKTSKIARYWRKA